MKKSCEGWLTGLADGNVLLTILNGDIPTQGTEVPVTVTWEVEVPLVDELRGIRDGFVAGYPFDAVSKLTAIIKELETK